MHGFRQIFYYSLRQIFFYYVSWARLQTDFFIMSLEHSCRWIFFYYVSWARLQAFVINYTLQKKIDVNLLTWNSCVAWLTIRNTRWSILNLMSTRILNSKRRWFIIIPICIWFIPNDIKVNSVSYMSISVARCMKGLSWKLTSKPPCYIGIKLTSIALLLIQNGS